MNVQIAYNLFLVDHEAYCSEQSIVYYRFNVQKFVDFLSDQIGSAPDLIECDVISRELVLAYLSQLRGTGCKNTSYDPADYKIGDRILFPMATGRKVEEQTLIYRGKEDVKANNDTIYRCLVFSFVEYKKGKEKEVITFFISDDKNHLPIRLDMYLNFGSAKAFLKSVQGNRYPMTSVVKKK